MGGDETSRPRRVDVWGADLYPGLFLLQADGYAAVRLGPTSVHGVQGDLLGEGGHMGIGTSYSRANSVAKEMSL